MGNVKQTYEFDFEFNRKKIKQQLKEISGDVAELISSMGRASDKVTIFKDMTTYIENLDSAIAAFKSKNAGAISEVFDGLDADALKYVEKLFGVDGGNVVLFQELKKQVDALGKSGASLDKARKTAENINALLNSVGMSSKAIDLSIFDKGVMKPAQRLEEMNKALDQFVTGYLDFSKKIQGGIGAEGPVAGGGVSGGLAGENEEIKKQIDELEQQKKRYQEILDVFNGSKKINISMPKKNNDQIEYLRTLRDELKAADMERAKLEEAGAIGGPEYLQAVANYIEKASKVNAAFQHDNLTDGAIDWINSNMEPLRNAEAILSDFMERYKKIIPGIKQMYSTMIADVDSKLSGAQLNNGQGGPRGGVVGDKTEDVAEQIKLYNKLRDNVQKYYNVLRERDKFNPGSDEYNRFDKELQNIVENVRQLKTFDNAQNGILTDIFGDIEYENIKFIDTIESICALFEIQIPESAMTATTKLQEFFNLVEAISVHPFDIFGNASGNVDVGRYTERLEAAKAVLDALGEQGLLTAEELKSVEDAFNRSKENLESSTTHYDGYGNGYGYYNDDYYDEYEKEKKRADGLEQENAHLREKLSEEYETVRTRDSEREVADIDFSSLENIITTKTDELKQILNGIKTGVEKISTDGDTDKSEVDIMKANLQKFFSMVSEKNSQKSFNGKYQSQELGMHIMSDNSISVGYGEDGRVPLFRTVEALLANLETSLIGQIHSHPLHFLKGKGQTGTVLSDNFSGSGGDLGFTKNAKSFGMQFMGMVTGKMLKTLDLSKLTEDQLKNFNIALAKIEKQYAKDPKYSRYIGWNDKEEKRFYKAQETIEDQHKVVEIFESMMYDAFSKIGLTKDKVDSEIFKQYDITDDGDLTTVAQILVTLSQAANDAITPINRLVEVIQRFGGDVTTDTAQALLKAYQKGEMKPGEVFNALVDDKYRVSQDAIDSILRIDTSMDKPGVEVSLEKIHGILNAIESGLQKIVTNTQLSKSENLQFIKDDLIGLKRQDYNTKLLSGVGSIFDPSNNSVWKGKETYSTASVEFFRFNHALDDVLTRISDGMIVTFKDIQDVFDRFRISVSYMDDAKKQLNLYGDSYGTPITDDKGLALSVSANKKYGQLLSSKTIDSLLSVVDYAQKNLLDGMGVQSDAKSQADVTVNTSDLESALSNATSAISAEVGKVVGGMTTLEGAVKDLAGKMQGADGTKYADVEHGKQIDNNNTELVSTLSTLSGALESLSQKLGASINAQPELPVVNTNAATATAQLESVDLATEIAQCNELLQTINLIVSRVNAKTEAFENEKKQANIAVNEEMQVLKVLGDYLTTLKGLIDGLLDNVPAHVNDFEQWEQDTAAVRENINSILNDLKEINNSTPKMEQPATDAGNSEETKDGGYAKESTLGEIKGVLERIDGKIVKDGDKDVNLTQIVNALTGATTELKNVANGIIEEHKRKKVDTIVARERIANSYDELASHASNAVAGLGDSDSIKIKGMRPLTDDIVRVEGVIKDASGTWKGFFVDVDNANKATIAATNTQSAYAKELNETADAAEKASSADKQDPAKKIAEEVANNERARVLQKITGQVNIEKGSLGFNFNARDLKPEQQEIVGLYDALIAEMDKYEIAIKNGQHAELDGIEKTKTALFEKIDAYKQANNIVNAGKTGNKKAPGATVVKNATTKFNALNNAVNTEELKQSSKVQKALSQYTTAYQKLVNLQNTYKVGQVLSKEQDQEFNDSRVACNNYAKDLEKLLKLYQNAKSEGDSSKRYEFGGDFQDTDTGRQKVFKEFLDQFDSANVAFEKFDDNYNKMMFTVNNGDGTFTKMTASINSTRTAIDVFAGETKEAKSAIGAFFDELKGKFKSIGAYLMASFSFHEVIQVVRQGINYIREIDSALAELKKVTDDTDASYDKFLQDMSKTGSVVGATVANLTTMAADWARLGYSMEEAGKLAESTAILLNVSEFDDATAASEALISTMQAFQYTADESQHVVDILNEVKITCLHV